jgi:hypothetical protein
MSAAPEEALQAIWDAHRAYLGITGYEPLPKSRTDARRLYGLVYEAVRPIIAKELECQP